MEWLQELLAEPDALEWHVVIVRLFTATLAGALVAGIYAWTHRRDESFTINFLATLVLLSILVATVTQVIGNNQARAFGLVGALAIVRFRTVVEDTRDTAFVMLAVIVGMAAGAGHLRFGLVALLFCTIAAIILQARRPRAAVEVWTLIVRVGAGPDPGALVQATFDKQLASSRLAGTSTARQGAAIEMTWTVTLRPTSTATALVAELNRLEGVQNVELRRQ